MRYGVPTFLMVLLSAAAAHSQATAVDWSAAQPVDITLANFSFTPADLHLKAGQPYRLHLVNQGSGGHNFAAPEFFQTAQIDPDDLPVINDGKVELGKGEARDLRLVPMAGTYKLKCTHFMHKAFGMSGSIVVE